MSIEGIALEIFSALPKSYINSTKPSSQCHTVFHSILSDDIIKDSATNTSHSKRLIAMLKYKNY